MEEDGRGGLVSMVDMVVHVVASVVLSAVLSLQVFVVVAACCLYVDVQT